MASARTCCFMVSASSSLGRLLLVGNKNSSEASLRGGDFLLLAMAPSGDSGRDAGRLCVRTALRCTVHPHTGLHIAHGTDHMGEGGDNGFSLYVLW